jgi:hypothetical protein
MSSTTSCSAAVASATAAVDSSLVVPDADADAAGTPRLDSASAAVRTSREDRRNNDMT